MTTETIRNCKICEKPTKTGCSRCKSVFYCSQECQARDWADHAPVCTEAWRQQKAQKKQAAAAAAAAALHAGDFTNFNRKRGFTVASQFINQDKDIDGLAKDGLDQALPKRKKIKWNCEPYLSTMRNAVRVCIEGQSTTKTAGEFGIPARTLRRYVANERRKRSQMASGPTGLYPDTVVSHYGPSSAGVTAGGNFRGPLGYPTGAESKLGVPSSANLLGGTDRSAFSRALETSSGLYSQDSLYYAQQRRSAEAYLKPPSDGFSATTDFNSSWPSPHLPHSQNLPSGNGFGYSSYLSSSAPKPYGSKPVTAGWPKATDRSLYSAPPPLPTSAAVLPRSTTSSGIQSLPPTSAGMLGIGPPISSAQLPPDSRSLATGLLRAAHTVDSRPPLTQTRLISGTAGCIVSGPLVRNGILSTPVGRNIVSPLAGIPAPAPLHPPVPKAEPAAPKAPATTPATASTTPAATASTTTPATNDQA